MTRQRLQFRFKKHGDLRLISHRDLARTFERLLRRIELPLAMSEGFHPHPKINFPSALAVGVEGESEVVEVAVSESTDIAAIKQRLIGQLPDGLTILDVRLMDDCEPKTHVEIVDYSIKLVDEQCGTVQTKIADFLERDSWIVERTNKRGSKQVDIRPGVHTLELKHELLTMRLTASQSYNVKPQEVLTLLGIENLESRGQWLTRTCVHVAS